MKSSSLKDRVTEQMMQQAKENGHPPEAGLIATASKKGKESEGKIALPAFDFKTMILTVVGISPVIVHCWSEKNARRMLDAQQKVASKGREKRDPLGDFRESLYTIHDENSGKVVDFGLPSPAFKACIVSGANDVDLKMTEIKRTIHVDFNMVPLICPPLAKKHYTEWDNKLEEELKFEHSKGCSMRQDFCRNDNGSADLRFRGCFPEWRCKLQIQFNRAVVSEEQLVNLVKISGWGVGVMEWRPSSPYVRSGEFGRFTVDEKAQIEVF